MTSIWSARMARRNALPGIISKITGGAMKRQWKVQRQLQAQVDGQRRWDRVYQLLMYWSQPATAMKEEAHERANWPLCTRIDSASSDGAKHRPAASALDDSRSRHSLPASARAHRH